MRSFVVSLLLLSAAAAVFAAPAVPGNAATAPKDAATLTLQVLDTKKKEEVLKALATSVFKVPVSQVKVVSSLDQSSLTNSQSVVIFEATGPTSNRKRVLVNCEDNTKGGWFGLTDSAAKKAVKKATDSWWPGDSVKIQKASCAQAPATAGRR